MYGWVALKSRVTIEGVYLKLPAGAVAALGQALIPYYTGQIIDYASIDQSFDGFQWTCLLLVASLSASAVLSMDSCALRCRAALSVFSSNG